MRQKDDDQGSVREGLPEAGLLMEGDTQEAAGHRLQGREQLLGLLGSRTPGRCVPNARTECLHAPCHPGQRRFETRNERPLKGSDWNMYLRMCLGISQLFLFQFGEFLRLVYK